MSFLKKLINKKEKETVPPLKPQDEPGFAGSFTIDNGIKPKERIIEFPKLDDDTSKDTLGGFNLITNFIANVISTHLIYSEMEVKNILRDIDYFCFHSPFYKMVQKAFTKMALT